MSSNPFQKATRTQARARVAFAGPAKAGKSFKYKTVAFGMASANKREDGTFDPVLYFAPDGTKVAAGTAGAVPVTAKAVALKVTVQ